MAEIRVTWDESAIKLSAQSQNSPVGRAMATLASETVAAMKREAPVAPYSRPATRRWPARRSGTLRSSIQAFRQRDGSWLIGATDRLSDGQFLATLVVRGTRPHEIRSHGPWSLHNPVTGRYYGRVAHHPGTKPDDFIRRAVMRMNGRRVVARLGRHRDMLPCLPSNCLTYNSRCYPIFQGKSGHRLTLLHPDSCSIDDLLSQL